MKKTFYFFTILVLISIGFIFDAKFASASSNAERLKGRMLLEVESNGEAWYVSPKSLTRYYLGRPEEAFNIMKDQGIGITNDNLEKIEIGLSNLTGQDSDGDGLTDLFEEAIATHILQTDTDGDGYGDKEELENNYDPRSGGVKLKIDLNFAEKQKGKIFIQTEQNGEAWYVNPVDGKRYFLGRPADAFAVMRNLGLGISNNDLLLIKESTNHNKTKVELIQSTNKGIYFVNHEDGKVVDTGAKINVLIETSGGLLLKNLMIFSNSDDDFVELIDPPYIAEFTVTQTYGNFVVSALGEGDDGELYSASVKLNIRDTAILEEVKITEYLFMDIDNPMSISVTGKYSDDTVRDISQANLGTIYTSGDENVLTVDKDGLVTAKKLGVAFVKVDTINGESEIVRVEVE